MSPAVLLAATALVASGPPASNQTILTKRESQRLVDYSAAIGSCLGHSGLSVSRPRVTRKQIELEVAGAPSQRAVVQAGIRCGTRIGDPPLGSSMQGFRDRVVLYVPKQCLIDKTVTTRAS